MSKNVAVFVDVANLYYAARGQDVDVDYVALLKHATKGRDLIRAYAYSGLDPENENQKKFLEFLSKNGYKVVAKDIRKFGDGRVKANLDIELVVDLFRLADRMDVAVIVSGDGDFAPAIRALQDEGVRCEVISFKPNTSSDLFAVADEFVDAMKISAISRQKDTKGVGAPEMPAKEVNPDVGFREASPSVAAAALAAIRSDGEDGAGRGRGRAAGGRRAERTSRPARGTRSRTTEKEPIAISEASAAADAGPPAARIDAGDESAAEGARRRRRRGGRGRGRRGRRGDVPEAASAASDAEPAEISWQELDSLEELEGLVVESATGPEREFEFEEADAGTLAELGLGGQPAAGEVPIPEAATIAAEADATETPASASAPKGRSRKPSSRAASKAAPESTSKAAAKSRARSTAKAGAKATASSRGSGAAAKPRAARTSRSKAAAAPASESDQGSDEGIWKRFTSGRGSRKRATPEPPEAA